MPNCFALIRDGNRVPLQQVDDEMRAHFGAPPNKTEWLYNWYNSEGLLAALGWDWARMRAEYPSRAPIIDWLESQFTIDAWVEGR